MANPKKLRGKLKRYTFWASAYDLEEAAFHARLEDIPVLSDYMRLALKFYNKYCSDRPPSPILLAKVKLMNEGMEPFIASGVVKPEQVGRG